ncbi:DUF4442 domain-containing protein [bacterium]|nr:DUF4442 domain-containing protein [bacterium]
MNPEKILRTWVKLQKLPAGALLFSRVLGRLIPYTGTIPFKIVSLEPGFAQITMKDCRRVRNHLDCIHAMALANLAELTSGLALTTGLTKKHRAILVGYEITYHKKARGQLLAESRFDSKSLPIDTSSEQRVEVSLKNKDNDVVCKATALWKVAPVI